MELRPSQYGWLEKRYTFTYNSSNPNSSNDPNNPNEYDEETGAEAYYIGDVKEGEEVTHNTTNKHYNIETAGGSSLSSRSILESDPALVSPKRARL